MAQYADVIEIVAPSQALPGERVDITVKIKNLYSATISIEVAGNVEHSTTPRVLIDFPVRGADIAAGAIYSFSGSFIMPSSNAIIHAYSYWYGADGAWRYDDEMTKAVAKMEVVYDFVIGQPSARAV